MPSAATHPLRSHMHRIRSARRSRKVMPSSDAHGKSKQCQRRLALVEAGPLGHVADVKRRCGLARRPPLHVCGVGPPHPPTLRRWASSMAASIMAPSTTPQRMSHRIEGKPCHFRFWRPTGVCCDRAPSPRSMWPTMRGDACDIRRFHGGPKSCKRYGATKP